MPLDIHVRAAARAGLGKEEEVHQLAEEQFQRQVTLIFFSYNRTLLPVDKMRLVSEILCEEIILY